MQSQKFFTYFIAFLIGTLSVSFISLMAVVTQPYWSAGNTSSKTSVKAVDSLLGRASSAGAQSSHIKIISFGRDKPHTHVVTQETTSADIRAMQPAMAFQKVSEPTPLQTKSQPNLKNQNHAKTSSPALKTSFNSARGGGIKGQKIQYQMTQNALILTLPQRYASEQNIKRAVSRLLVSDHLVSPDALLSRQSFSMRKLPYFYGQVLDAHHRPIRYPHQAYAYAEYLMKKHLVPKSQQGRQWIELHMPLAKKPTLAPVKKYQDWVADYAKQFEVDPALVFAVMETESGFNPKAVSRSNALGLMQLKPHTAGLDVSQHIDLNNEVPDQEVLFNSQKNIRMGTAYLGLLQNKYLSDVRNKLSKKILAVAAYNGGLSTVLKLFGKTKPEAIAKLNRLHPKQIYRTLRQQHQSAETRAYIDKVLKAEQKYQEIIHS